MTLRRFLVSLIALAVIVAAPGLVAASVCDSVTVSSPTADDGCCGGANMSSCLLPCALGQAAVGSSAGNLMPLLDGLPPKGYSAGALSVSRPPDTAPPKFLSA